MAGCGGKMTDKNRKMTAGPVYDAVVYDKKLWEPPEYEVDEALSFPDGIKGIWYTTYCNGRETKAFAYLGIPENCGRKKLPGILLIHGGGGTAYHEWAKQWTARGYVALAPDFEGHVPLKTATMLSPPKERYTKSGYLSYSNKNYGDAAGPIRETWMYYATATAIAGNSLLHSLDVTDKYKIGVCGVSWGGIITSVISGYDDRFAFSIPIYCTLNIAGTGGFLSGFYKDNPAALIWDGDGGLSQRETPVLILAANTDSVNSSSALSNSITYAHCKNARLLLIDNFEHGHHAAACLPQAYLFADSIVRGGRRFLRVVKEPTASDPSVVCDADRLEDCTLWYTEDDPAGQSALWRPAKCRIDNNSAAATVPEEARYFYFLADDGYSETCSGIVKMK